MCSECINAFLDGKYSAVSGLCHSQSNDTFLEKNWPLVSWKIDMQLYLRVHNKVSNRV